MRNRAWRRSKTKRYINKQLGIAHTTRYYNDNFKRYAQPHRNHKHAIFDCGQPDCVICGNPRRFFGEKTIQERKFECLPEEKADGDWVDQVVVENWADWKDWELMNE